MKSFTALLRVLLTILLLLLLPFHLFILSIATKVGVPAIVLRLMPLWKEIIILLLLLLGTPLLGKLMLRKRVRQLDLLVALFGLVTVLYGIASPSLSAGIYGIRNTFFFWILPYALGRIYFRTPKRLHGIVKVIFVVAVAAVISALVEKLILPENTWVRIGLADYLSFVDSHYKRAPNGLPWTFYNSLGEYRSAGIFANPLGMAQGVAMLIPLLVIFTLRRISTRRGIVLTIGALIAIYFSGSRTNTAIAAVLFMITVFKFNKKLFLFISIVAVISVVSVLANSSELRTYLFDTLTFQESSTVVHLSEWVEGLDAFIEQPLGRGLGTSGNIGAVVNQNTAIGGESDYIVTLVQMGVIGLILKLLIYSKAALYSWRHLSKRTPVPYLYLYATAFGALFVIMVAGLTSEVSLFPRLAGWFVLGVTYSLSEYRGNITPSMVMTARSVSV